MDREKETPEEEESQLHRLAAAASVEAPDLPIMHWEDLSQRIAELEKQEQERKERSKRGTGVRTEDGRGAVWEEEEGDFRRCRVTQRLHNHRNLQLCFINNSDSEEEDEGGSRKVGPTLQNQVQHGPDHEELSFFITPRQQTSSDLHLHQVSRGTAGNGCHAAGLKQEVATALRTLRDKLLAEQKEKEQLASSSAVAGRKHLERSELQECSRQQLRSLRASLQQEAHALSSELVTHLLVRDQLRTRQDALLLDVQDLT